MAKHAARKTPETKWLLLLAEQTSDGIVITDAAGLIRWINPGFSRICGYSLAEVHGKKPGGFLQGPLTDPATVDYLRHSIAAQADSSAEILNYHKDGRSYWVTLHITPIIDRSGQVARFIAIEREISAPKHAQPACETNDPPPDRMIAICAACKKIRDRQGDWIQVETYFHQHMQLEFTHTICAECGKRLYGAIE